VRLRFQPAAEHGRRQVFTPQFGRRWWRTIRTGRAPWQWHGWPVGCFVRAVGRILGLSALGRAPGFQGRNGVFRTGSPARCPALSGAPPLVRRSGPQRVLVPRGDAQRACANAVIQAAAAAAIQAGTGAVLGGCAVTVGRAYSMAVGRARTATADRVTRPHHVLCAQRAVGGPVTCSAMFLGVAPPLGFAPLEFARDRGEHTLPQVFGNDPKLDPHRGPGGTGRSRNAARKRRDAAVIYHAATPRRPAHERDACLDSGTYIAWLIQPKSQIVAMKLPKVRTPS